MRLLSEIEMQGKEYFSDLSLEVEEKINNREAILYFAIEISRTYGDNFVDGYFESRYIDREEVYADYDCGYFTDNGALIELYDNEKRELENKVKQLIKNEL